MILCRFEDLEDREARGFELDSYPDAGGEPTRIVVVRLDDQLYGWVNRCPHEPRRLDADPGEFWDASRRLLVCAHHAASFSPSTGQCFLGPCQNQPLTPVALKLEQGAIMLAE